MKATTLMLIAMTMILTLSCSLPLLGKSNIATQQTSSDTASVLQSPEPNQEQKPSPPAENSNPSASQGGISARQGYEDALKKALEWNPNATLTYISLPYESRSVNREGKGKGWVYTFVDNTLQIPEDRSQGFFVNVGESGVVDAQPASINIQEGQIQAGPADWLIDSDKAVTICDQNGGADYLSAHPEAIIDAQLDLYDYSSTDGLPLPTEKNIRWWITYKIPDQGSGLNCNIDGTTGKIFALQPSLVASNSDNPVTARSHFDQVMAKAQEWDPGAVLVSVRNTNPEGGKTMLVEGKNPYWRYKFLSLPTIEEADFQRSFEIIEGPNGILGFQEFPDPAGYSTIGNSTDWVIDSDEAFRIAEESGGKAFREQYPNATVGMELNFGFYPVADLNTMKNVRWEILYSAEDDSDTEITYYIDGTDGKLVDTYP